MRPVPSAALGSAGPGRRSLEGGFARRTIRKVSLALGQLTRSLHSRIVPLLDLSDLSPAKVADPEASEKLTRALAAAAVISVALADDVKAAQSVTDGTDDRGIDALLVDSAHSGLLLVQSKWSKDGRGSISKGDLLKFIDGFREMMQYEWSVFNPKIRARSAAIEGVLDDPNVRIILCLATSSDTDLSTDAAKVIKSFLREVNTAGLPPMVTFQHVKLSDVHAATIGRRAIHLDATLENWGPIGEPFTAQYGVINASDLADWYRIHGERLFESNIRQPLGRTPVNEAIRDTLIDTPEQFWYLNNGVTVLADHIAKSAKGGASRTQGSFKLTNASVVNGAQTVSTIFSTLQDEPECVALAKVAIRFISLDGCPPDFAIRVTRATNTQNSVESRDFVALDPVQERLRDELLAELGKSYSIRRGETTPSPQMGCTVVDATVALACRRGPGMAVMAKATIGRIWDSVGRAPYTDLFNDSTTSIEVWRSVEILRAVDHTLEGLRKSSHGRAAAFAVQGNRLVLSMVFDLLPGNFVDFDDHRWARTLSKVPNLTTRVFRRMNAVLESDFAENYLAALTKNTGRSRALFEQARRTLRRSR